MPTSEQPTPPPNNVKSLLNIGFGVMGWVAMLVSQADVCIVMQVSLDVVEQVLGCILWGLQFT